MKAERILYCIFGLFLFAACSGGEDYERQLERFEEMNQKFQPIRSDSLIREVVEYYDHWWHSRNHRMRAYYMLGCAYRDMGNAPRALENYQKAASLADSTEGRFLPALMRIHSQMCGLYAQQRLKKEMLTESEIAARFAWKTGDSESALILESDYCHALYSDGMYEECIKEALELHAKFMEYGYRERALAVYANCVKSYLALKDYPHAKEYLDLYQTCSYFKDSPQKIHGGMSSLYLLKGQYYAGVGATDSAEYYFRKLLQQPDFENNQLLATKGLYQIYYMKGDVDSVMKYTQLYSEAKERNFDTVQSSATLQAKSLYDYSSEQKIAKEKTVQSSQRKNAIYSLVSLCIVGILFYLYQQEKKKREIVELQRELHSTVHELHALHLELQIANREKAKNDYMVNNYLQVINQKQSQIADLENKIRRKTARKKQTRLKSTTIAKIFSSYRNEAWTGNEISKEHWTQLKQTVEQSCPTFYAEVNRHHQLSEIEYRICLLIKIGCTPSDIDIILKKDYTFASTMRKRLCKKILQKDGEAAQLDKFIDSL